MSKRLYMLLDRSGEQHGFAIDSEPVTLTTPGGATVHFGPGASSVSIPTRSTPIFGGPSSSSLAIDIEGRFVRRWWDERHAAPIQSAKVVWWWADPTGGVIRDGDEIFRGRVRSPKWIVGADTASLSIEVPQGEAPLDVPFPPNIIGDNGRFPQASDDAKPHACPIIYGTVRGLPLYKVATTRWIIAGHPIESTSVTVRSRDEDVGLFDVQLARDSLGGLYSYVDLPEGTENGVYAVEVKGKAQSRLGAVLLDLVRTYGEALIDHVDMQQVSAAAPALDRMGIGFYVNEPTNDGSILQFIETRIQGQFPVLAGSSRGLLGWSSGVLPRPGEAAPAASLVYGVNVHARGEVAESDADEVIAEVALAYRTDGYVGGTTAERRVVSGVVGPESVGRSRMERIEAGDVVDDATAYLIAANRLLIMGRVRTRIEYQQADAELWDLPNLSLVEVTDHEIGLDRARFFIEAARPREDGSCDVILVSE